MSTISLYTTAATTSEADLLLDTHINILPSSPDIIRFQCALRARSSKHDLHGPIFAGENTLLDVHDALPAYLCRITAIVTQRALGRLVLVKNGSTAWRTHLDGDSRKEDAVEDVQILFHGSGLDSTSNEDRNHLRISDLAAQQWLDKYTIRTAGRSVLEVQDDLRRILIEHSPRKLLGLSSDMHMRPFINRQELHAVIALGGMSECGKSTIGKEVDTLLGEKGRREKFAYFFDKATKELRTDVYDLPDKVQGQLLVQQIEEYSKSHYWVSVISLESLHRFGSIAEVKRILGNLLHIVFVDVAEEERVRRQISRVGPERAEEKVLELKRKDEIKAARGALRVRDIADTVLDNHGRSEDTQKVLIQILNLLSVRKYNM